MLRRVVGVHRAVVEREVRDVAIRVLVEGERYQVIVTPPEGAHGQSSEAMSAAEVLRKLQELGCHSTDITHALYAADPQWTSKHDEEVRTRRRLTSDESED